MSKEKTYKLQGKDFKLAAPTLGRLDDITKADNANLQEMFDSIKSILIGPVDDLDFREMDIRDINEIILDFLAMANPIAAEGAKASLGLRKEKTS